MSQELRLQQLNLHPGVPVRIKGYVPANPKTYEMNLGKDDRNIGLHFNPRFDHLHDHQIIIYNSKKDGVWNEERRERVFPFQEMKPAEVNFDFDTENFTVKLHDGHQISFPNRLGLQKIDFISIYGDFRITRVEFE